MSVTLTLGAVIKAVETLSAANTPAAAAANRVVTHDQFNQAKTLDANSTPPVSKPAFFTEAMSGGAATIDLTALVGSAGGAVNGNGLKAVALILFNPATNANAIAIVPGASNGYPMCGSDWKTTLQPGQWELHYLAGAAGTIGSGSKTLDISGTGSQVLSVGVVMG